MGQKSDCCIIFPHIPKCFGTSLKTQLEQADIRIFFDYDHPPHHAAYFQKACERRNRDYSLLDFGSFDLVFGHFPIQRYCRPNYRYITLLRDPLERAVSQFFYLKYGIPADNRLAFVRNPDLEKIQRGQMDFLEFIRTHHIDAFYQSFLGEMKPSDFLLVGFTQRYSEFIDRLSDYLAVRLSPDVHLRKGEKGALDSCVLDTARDLLSREIAWYETFYRYWT